MYNTAPAIFYTALSRQLIGSPENMRHTVSGCQDAFVLQEKIWHKNTWTENYFYTRPNQLEKQLGMVDLCSGF